MAVRVLLIEDDLFLRDIYNDFLKGEGYEVALAVDGAEGLTKIKEGNWDMVLVDDNLPKMMGLDVLREARKIKPAPSKKFIFLTNSTESDDPTGERSALSDAYLVKSEYSPTQLIEKLREYTP